jgi:hypothetical protein
MLIRLSALVLTFAACAASPKQTNGPGQGSGSGSGSNVTCHEVTDTGSMFSHTECTTVEEKDAEHQGAQDFMTRPRSQPTGSKYH